VTGDDFGKVRELLRECGELLFLCSRLELAGLCLPRQLRSSRRSRTGTVFSWSAKP
jgi:hypothetical protein